MLSARIALAACFFVLAAPASADKGGGHVGDTSPGNSGDHKVVICHHAGPNKVILITVDKQGQVNGHLKHGDTLGACPVVVVVPPPPTVTETTPTITEPEPYAVPEVPAAPEEVPAEPDQLVAPDREAGKGDSPEAKQVRRERRAVADEALQQKLTAEATKQTELPHTGLPVALVAALGLVAVGAGSALRARVL